MRLLRAWRLFLSSDDAFSISAVLLAASAVNVCVSLLYTVALLPDERGFLGLLVATSYLASGLGSLGVPNYIYYSLAQRRSSDNIGDLEDAAPISVLALALVSMFSVTLGLVGQHFYVGISSWDGISSELVTFFFVAMCLSNCMSGCAVTSAVGLGGRGAVACLSLASPLVNFITVAIILFIEPQVLKFGLISITLVGYALGSMLTALISLIWLGKVGAFRKGAPSWYEMTYSLGTYPQNLMSVLVKRLEIFFVDRIVGGGELLGIYAVGMSLRELFFTATRRLTSKAVLVVAREPRKASSFFNTTLLLVTIICILYMTLVAFSFDRLNYGVLNGKYTGALGIWIATIGTGWFSINSGIINNIFNGLKRPLSASILFSGGVLFGYGLMAYTAQEAPLELVLFAPSGTAFLFMLGLFIFNRMRGRL